MTTVNNDEREAGFKEAFVPTLLKHNVNDDRLELSRRPGGHTHQPETVLIAAGSKRLHQ